MKLNEKASALGKIKFAPASVENEIQCIFQLPLLRRNWQPTVNGSGQKELFHSATHGLHKEEQGCSCCCRTANKFSSRQLAHIFREPQDTHVHQLTNQPHTCTHAHSSRRRYVRCLFWTVALTSFTALAVENETFSLTNGIQKRRNYLFKFCQH